MTLSEYIKELEEMRNAALNKVSSSAIAAANASGQYVGFERAIKMAREIKNPAANDGG